MSEKLRDLKNKYEAHLKQGEEILRELQHLGKSYGPQHQQQVAINAIWRMVLNDFESLTDTDSYESKEK